MGCNIFRPILESGIGCLGLNNAASISIKKTEVCVQHKDIRILVVIMCLQLYLMLCSTYMSTPFKIITLILGLILFISAVRIVMCNEK